VLLSNINYIVKDISHLSLYKVKYKSINNKLILNLNLLVLKYKGDAIYKRIKVFKLNYNRVIKSIKQRGALLKS
jgi:hypothetical protein